MSGPRLPCCPDIDRDMKRLVFPADPAGRWREIVGRSVTAEIIHHARRGLVPKQIAWLVGRSQGRVNNILRAAGWKWRRLDRVKDIEIAVRIAAGQTHRQIADAYMVDRATVSGRVRRMRQKGWQV